MPPGRKHKIPLNGKWLQLTDEALAKFSEADRELFLNRELLAKDNPLAYFLPHGRRWSARRRVIADGKFVIPPSDYPEEWKNDGVAFLNDYTSDVCLLLGPNQQGKSVIGTVWSALRVVKCEPWWPIFTETPVIYPGEWSGPKQWVVASYSWDNVTTIWKRYQEFLPRYELGQYAADWGSRTEDVGARRTLTFGDGRTKTCELTGGSTLMFRCYTQQQMHWEGFESDGAQLDEQSPIEKMTGLQRGFTTRGDYTPICMTLTGHVLDDRPDTGASGWIKRELWDTAQDSGSYLITD